MRALVLCTAFAVVGCEGSILLPDGPDDDVPQSCDVADPNPGRAPLRRLTVVEYDNTVRDIFGDASEPAARLVDPERGALNTDARLITPLLAEQYLLAAEDVAARAMTDLDALLPCDRAVDDDAACVAGLVDELAPRLFRRPITAAERAALVDLHAAITADLGFDDGVRGVLEAMLQTPQFLYRLEPVEDGEGVVRLDGWQLATRLSYTLWSTTPDGELMAAAAAGELDTDVGVEAHARRMLDDSRAAPTIQRFFATWLDLATLDGVIKDTEVFPGFTPQTPDLLRAEIEAFVDAVMFEGDANWRTVMTAPWTMVNDDLAAFYGVEPPGTGDFVRLDLDPQFHAGILTKGGILAGRDRPYESSPIHRGMFIRAGLICGEVPDVPEGLEVTPPDPDPDKTTRERLAEHRADPVCASCHDQIDPLGFTLEHFDGSGRFRDTENGLPIDATGFLVDTDIDGPVDGPVDLASKLIDSDMARACFVKQWFRYAHARREQPADDCTIESLTQQFTAVDFDIRELIVAMTLSDAFLYRDLSAAAGEDQ